MTLRLSALVAALLASSPAARGDSPKRLEPVDSACSAELRAEMSANLWTRPAAPAPGRHPQTATIRYRNEYGDPAAGLLFALDGVVVRMVCGVPTGPGDPFSRPLSAGAHHLDVVYNFGGGRVGRTPYAFRVKPGRDVSISVLLDRNDEEFPDAHFELRSARP
jgi:hypothetical protein